MKKNIFLSIAFLIGMLLAAQVLVAQPASDKTAQRLLHINGKGEVLRGGTKLGYISKEDIVFNNQNQKLGFIKGGRVYDAEGNSLGKAKKGGQYYNNNGVFVLEVSGNNEKCRILDARGHTIGYVHRNYKLHACAVHCFFKEQKIEEDLAAILAGYMNIENALVNDDYKAAQQNAQELSSTALNETSVKNTLEQLSGSADISDQRKHFAALSKELYTVFKDIDLQGNTLYWNNCHMAMNGEGANWLSMNEKISNPYMGQKMPGCGSVQETLNK
ncbi:DUF3347 domain-containing protein [Marinoscillum luteum]|uniref:DUF3347 domain-containing protein n=1 Tax=Marinoscillum luteum TaxID=861051 RepID=A0ABW7N6W4_9BACT